MNIDGIQITHPNNNIASNLASNLALVNCALYIKLNVKGIFALVEVYLKSSQCQADTPHNQPNI